MAAVKEYGYYIKANEIKLVERDVNFDNDPNSKTYGPGVDRGEWKSPLTDVSHGLQIQYTYVPSYRVNDADDQVDSTAYTEYNGLLSLTVGSMSATKNDWILITDSDRWNGLHQVAATISSDTTLTLTTNYNGGSVSTKAKISTDITMMEDESFELDLPDNLNLALEYYLKARLLEQAMQIEQKEYYMKEFRKQVEKHDTSRQWGVRMVGPGPHAIR